jgi:phosphate starvation-inducible protein PhoH
LPRTKRKDREFFLEKDPRFIKRESKDNLIQIKPYIKRTQEVSIIPRNLNQENYIELLKKNQMLFYLNLMN